MQEAWQTRVVQEHADLEEKASTLYGFCASKQFESLDPKVQRLLKQQYYTMMVYAGILEQRIELF